MRKMTTKERDLFRRLSYYRLTFCVTRGLRDEIYGSGVWNRSCLLEEIYHQLILLSLHVVIKYRVVVLLVRLFRVENLYLGPC